MRLIKLPKKKNPKFKEDYFYVNPDNVSYLYSNEIDCTRIVTVETSENEFGLKIALPMDEVASRLVNGEYYT